MITFHLGLECNSYTNSKTSNCHVFLVLPHYYELSKVKFSLSGLLNKFIEVDMSITSHQVTLSPTSVQEMFLTATVKQHYMFTIGLCTCKSKQIYTLTVLSKWPNALRFLKDQVTQKTTNGSYTIIGICNYMLKDIQVMQ